MDYKNAIEIIKKMLDKYRFSPEEKEAVLKGMGTLNWASLAENRMKGVIKKKKEKKKRDLEW
jgi:hypothetical protein